MEIIATFYKFKLTIGTIGNDLKDHYQQFDLLLSRLASLELSLRQYVVTWRGTMQLVFSIVVSLPS